MIKLRLLLTLVFLLLSLTAPVSAQNRKAGGRARDFFPLRVGDSWTYRHNEGDAEFIVKVLSAEKQSDGSLWYLLEKLAGVQIHSWYSKIDGWALLHGEAYLGQENAQARYEPPRQYLKNPLVAGAKWSWKGKGVMGQEIIEFNEVIGPQMVKVPAGTFRAMKILSRVTDGDSASTKTYWYADGVGLVKSMTEGGQLKYGWELVDYSFKKGGRKN
jgi:hypothetical protein